MTIVTVTILIRHSSAKVWIQYEDIFFYILHYNIFAVMYFLNLAHLLSSSAHDNNNYHDYHYNNNYHDYYNNNNYHDYNNETYHHYYNNHDYRTPDAPGSRGSPCHYQWRQEEEEEGQCHRRGVGYVRIVRVFRL